LEQATNQARADAIRFAAQQEQGVDPQTAGKFTALVRPPSAFRSAGVIPDGARMSASASATPAAICLPPQTMTLAPIC